MKTRFIAVLLALALLSAALLGSGGGSVSANDNGDNEGGADNDNVDLVDISAKQILVVRCDGRNIQVTNLPDQPELAFVTCGARIVQEKDHRAKDRRLRGG
jgi:hypothetical protein